MAQIGEGHEAQGAAPQVLTFGSPSVGEILADRYQIESHIGDDSLGRQLYRGSDVVLRRPVTVVLRRPGGEAAGEMLAAAVAASRVVHPHLVGVYDAIDEGDRAYVVREWIDGISLREVVSEGPVDAGRATAIAWAVADAVAALHATGVVHGNVHPGTVMIAQDGRVMLADARADDAATPEADVRAIGGVLYCALTGFWPHREAGAAPVADGVYDNGTLVAPGQLRAGVPPAIDDLTLGLLAPGVHAPAASMLAADLAGMSRTSEEALDDNGALGFAAFDAAAVPAGMTLGGRRRVAIGVVVLIALALLGVAAATQFGGSGGGDSATQSGTQTTTPSKAAVQPHQLKIAASQVRIVDPPKGDRSEVKGAQYTVDGDLHKGWRTESYNEPNFGNGLKPGMGILIDLGKPRKVTNVQVELSRGGATLDLRAGDTDPAAGKGDGTGTSETDQQVYDTFRVVDKAKTPDGPRVVFNGDDKPARYVMVFLTNLPPDDSGGYQIEVEEISVNVQ